MTYSYEWAGISWDCEGGPRMVWRHGTCAGDSYARYWGGWVGWKHTTCSGDPMTVPVWLF